ncbi:Non-repetitive/WGA-negative nucleoporin C-terminal-domain-containing protein [Poronia punctata]|nr:Non-repetitive/WGA-negative nucleoporin C-terminal-domain-containing protein [Poronia punctata]
MFAPAPANGSQNGPATSMATRSRRRQRPLSSDNSLQQPKSKRLRSDRPQVTEQTFVEPATAPETFEVKAAQPVAEIKQDGVDRPMAVPRRELSVRSKKSRPGDRLHKGDGSILLSTNTGFDVKKLPALPDGLKLDAASRQHGYVNSTTGAALSISHTHAVVWPYAAVLASPEAFTFTLPYPSKHSTDPLPLGSLVSPSASSTEPGLVIVMPTTGKITYWESIASATTLDFIRQRRTGLEDSIPGMYSGERVLELVNLEAAAGFVLAFTSGRIAYMSVRDAQGRPKISVQFLRTSLGPSNSGIFGSIRNVLSHSSPQGDIAAVRADRSSKQGECTVVAATSKGRISSWRIHRGGHHDVLAELDARSSLVEAVQNADPTSRELATDSFKIVDFCFVPKGMSSKYTDMSQLRASPAVENEQHILLLTSLDYKDTCRYNLVEVVISNDPQSEAQVEVGMVRTISSFSTPPNPHALARPRLYLPKPAVIAFLVFDHATVVASIAQPPESPDSQIMQDNHTLPAAFEDVVGISDDSDLEIIGSGLEEPQINDLDDDVRPVRIKTKNPTVVLLVRGAGTMRVAVYDYPRFASTSPPKITAKTKLEQAVFFGTKEDNPLRFDLQHNIRFTNEEYGKAALELSEQILTSSGPHLSSLAPKLENNIKERVDYLGKMMAHMKKIGVDLDRKTKWQLLWDAEKMQVASTLWRKHELFLRMPHTESKNIVAETVEFIRSEERSKPDPSKGETDQLRHWFVHDVHRMELFIAWAYEVIKYHSRAKLDMVSLTRLVYEASEVYNSTIRAAFSFRESHLELYGLADEKLDHGILEGSYAGLPMPWTANRFIVNNMKRQVELDTQWLKDDVASLTAEQIELNEKTRQILPEMTAIYLSTLQELTRWDLASGESRLVEEGQRFQEVYEQDRHDKVVLLYQSENWEAAIKLAEIHRSLPALAEVLTRRIDSFRDAVSAPGLSPGQIAAIEAKMTEKEDKVRECFATYGEEFAFPFYQYLFETYGVDALLEYDGDKTYKTMYLRTKPELAKISWINDIVGEEDIDHAANTLLDLGLAREQQIWNKKIELSLGKLARMAESSRPSSKASMSVQEVVVNGVTEDARVNAIDKELAVINIQNEFYDTQIRPLISVALDETEELGLVKEAFTLRHPKRYKIVHQIFEDGMKRLLKHEALDPLTLIDLLTLVTLPAETRDGVVDQFFLALKVASNGLHDAERVQAERLIWRRCFLREDWTAINETTSKDDATTLDVLGVTDLFQIYCTLYANGKKMTVKNAYPSRSMANAEAEQGKQEKTEFRRLMPSAVLGVYTETLDRRFTNMEKGYREKVVEAMRWEDALLRKFMEKHRLAEWAKETQKLAEQAVDEQFDNATENGSVTSLVKSLPLKRARAKLLEGPSGRNGTH